MQDRALPLFYTIKFVVILPAGTGNSQLGATKPRWTPRSPAGRLSLHPSPLAVTPCLGVGIRDVKQGRVSGPVPAPEKALPSVSVLVIHGVETARGLILGGNEQDLRVHFGEDLQQDSHQWRMCRRGVGGG